MDLDKTIEYFASLVDKRIEVHGHKLSSEDTIRYDFFFALTEVERIQPWEVILEAPYPNDILNLERNSSEIDLMILPNDKRSQGLICEFKYDRKANSTINKTNRYGKLINDILRLSLLDHYKENHQCLFIYVTDSEMMKYKNGFHYQQHINEILELKNEFIDNLPKSARDQINLIFLNAFISQNFNISCKLIYKNVVDISHSIYVWNIKYKHKLYN